MNPSFEIHRRRLYILCSLILLCALSICVSAAKFCVAETSVDFARAARFCVHTNLTKEELELYNDKERQGMIPFSVSNFDGEGVSEVRIEYDLIFTLPERAAKYIEEIRLYSGDQIKTIERTNGKRNAIFKCSGAGIFEAGQKSEQSYSLYLKAKEGNKRSFQLKLALSARQIFSGD